MIGLLIVALLVWLMARKEDNYQMKVFLYVIGAAFVAAYGILR